MTLEPLPAIRRLRLIPSFRLWLLIGMVGAFQMNGCGGGGSSGGGSGGTGPAPNGAMLSVLAGNVSGFGNNNGTGAVASFFFPEGIATDAAGNIYVADTFNQTIRKITPKGVVTTLAGTPGFVGSADGNGAAASFSQPIAVATDAAGNVYVADMDNSAIRKITPTGAVTTLAGKAAGFLFPTGIAVDAAGNIYVADGAIVKITPAGVVTTLAGGLAANGVAVDAAGNVYAADSSNQTILKITPAGVVTTLAGNPGVAGSADGTGAAASFCLPPYNEAQSDGEAAGIAVDAASNVYVADFCNSTIRKITPAGVVTTLAGTAGVPGSADGTGAPARFNLPQGLAVDAAGNVYVGDTNNSTIRKMTAGAVVTTLAGTAATSGSADGTGAAASFHNPNGVAVDAAENVYVVDSGNSTIRKITPAGVVTTLAGTAGVTGSADGAGAAASFNLPDGVAVDAAGNVYVADTGNATIRKITPAGVVSTLAGKAGVTGSADGTGATARFTGPGGVAVDAAGNIYVLDGSTIRKITSAGVVTTPASNPGLANSPALAVNAAGNVYVVDSGNRMILQVTPDGVVTTLAGNPGLAGSVDGTGVVPFSVEREGR